MKTYEVKTYNDKATYTVSLDEAGVKGVDGLFPETATNLMETVQRYMERRRLSSEAALVMAIGPYSYISAVDGESVADSA